MATCLIVVAITAILITNVAIIISYATPNWVTFERNATAFCDCLDCDCGIWLYCKGGFLKDGSTENCHWFFSDNFKLELKLPDWFQAVQGLMTCAVVTSFIALIIGLFSLCCYCKNCNPHQAAAGFIGLTFCLLAAAVCLFGVKGHLDYGLGIFQSDNPATPQPILSWSFWVAVGAAALALLSSLLYCCVGQPNDDEYV
ncbi:hypothetical protein BsWGS_28953 [Bradybaena similaris]